MVWFAHPQALAPAPLTPQTRPAMQVLGQVTGVPQLFVAGPQALPEHAAVSFAAQPHPFAPALPPPQVFTPVQVLVQVMTVPQLFVAGPQALPTHAAALSGTH